MPTDITLLLISLVLNIILLFILLSPNINYFFNKRWFKWRDDDNKKIKNK